MSSPVPSSVRSHLHAVKRTAIHRKWNLLAISISSPLTFAICLSNSPLLVSSRLNWFYRLSLSSLLSHRCLLLSVFSPTNPFISFLSLSLSLPSYRLHSLEDTFSPSNSLSLSLSLLFCWECAIFNQMHFYLTTNTSSDESPSRTAFTVRMEKRRKWIFSRTAVHQLNRWLIKYPHSFPFWEPIDVIRLHIFTLNAKLIHSFFQPFPLSPSLQLLLSRLVQKLCTFWNMN